MKTFPSRVVNGLGLLLAVTSYLFAYFFLQLYLELEPCPLCMIDRVFVIASGVFFLLALVHNPNATGQRIYGFLAGLMALAGIMVCWRHIYLQNLPKDLVPNCAPGLDYMLETLPVSEHFPSYSIPPANAPIFNGHSLALPFQNKLYWFLMAFLPLPSTNCFALPGNTPSVTASNGCFINFL